MNGIGRTVAVLLCLVMLFIIRADAQTTDAYIQQQMQESGADDLWDRLSDETKEMYRAVGVEGLSDLMSGGLSADAMWEMVKETLSKRGRTPFSLLGILLCATVLCAYLNGWKDTLGGGGVQSVYSSVSILAVCTITAIPFAQCIRDFQSAFSGASVFMGSFSPVYIATLAAGGQLRTAVSYQTVLLLFSQVLTWFADGVLVPLLLVSFALGLVSAATDARHIAAVGERLLKAVTWTVGITATVFTTLLTVNGTLGAAGDTLSNRMVRLSISGFVPVVGGALSEAFLTVKGCVDVVRSVVGAFGMITTALMVLPTLLEVVCWQICLWLVGMATDMFAQPILGTFFKTIQQLTKTMIALLCVCALFMVIATAIVAKGASA